MRPNEKQGVRYYCFEALEKFPGLRHGVFSRHGGQSQGDFAGLNIGAAVGDAPRAVEQNRLAIAQVMGAEVLVFMKQVHGAEVLVLDSPPPKDCGRVWDAGRPADAVITNRPGCFLAVAVADCQPILIYDPENQAVAAVHSGWRGSIQNIAGAAVASMQASFGSRPAGMVACLGPSLGPCCAEFIHYKKEIPEPFWEYRQPNSHFDFWAATRSQLTEAGLLGKNIHCANVCTKCGPDDFFSYRRNNNTGRFAAVIGLAAGGQ